MKVDTGRVSFAGLGVLLKKGWVVERTFGWLMWCRRLVRDNRTLA
ncbi:hypothetical protein [Nostoc flagelliforme]|nr:hypothetical protein [Nostoc flagelliforme]